MKRDIDNQLSALTTTRGLLCHPKISWTLVHKRLQTRPPFLPTLCKFYFLCHCQASQTEISKQNSTKLCQLNRANNLLQNSWDPPGKNWGPRNVYICSVFRRLRHLMVNICWTKRDTDNQAKALESTKGFYVIPKFHELWSTNGLKPGRSFYPPSLFCSVRVHRTPSVRH